MNKNITIVTGLWDLGRDQIEGWANRSFEEYKARFLELLQCDIPMVIFIPKFLEEDVVAARNNKPTQIIFKENKDFETWNPFFEQIEQIRTNKDWSSIAGWLEGSPQAQLKYYNPMMFTKMFMLHDSTIMNPFNSEYFFWLDGGITNTVNKGYFLHDKVLDNLESYIDSIDNKLTFIQYPYENPTEIHGFKYNKMVEYSGGQEVKHVSRGGFFGGHKSLIKEINGIYYHLMKDTLKEGLMGADECFFTILSHKYKSIIDSFKIKGDGLVWPFFENLKSFKNKVVEKLKEIPKLDPEQPNPTVVSDPKSALYILTYNSPEQLSKLIDSFKQIDTFLPLFKRKYILDNSVDEKVFEQNANIARDNGFELIKKDNLGICGGRQFVAEHFDSTDCEYMMFYEDDMFMNPPSEKGFCKNGFRKYVDNIIGKTINIMDKKQFDFLKISFTEFFGDNRTQWSWYNVPQSIRTKFWPEYDQLPELGLDPNAPLAEYKFIHIEDDLTYVSGDVYYSNWPQIVSKEGNRKMFLDTKWARPYEQTWMSHIFQETKKGNIKPAILLASPITHDRFIHYDRSLRKES